MDQQSQGYLHPEQCLYLGGMTNFPPPDVQMAADASGNTTSLDPHSLPDPYDGSMYYGIPQYPGVQHHHPHPLNLDLGVGTASGFYFPYITNPSSSIPLNQGSVDHLPSSSNYCPLGIPADEYGRNCHFMDSARNSYKRKTTEGIQGNFHYLNAPSGPSSSVMPLNTRHPDGLVDAASFTLPQYRANGAPSIREVGPHRSVRNRLGATAIDPVPMHNHNHFFQGNYMNQSFPPAMTDGGASSWGQAQAISFMHGSNVSGPRETGHRTSTTFINSSPLNLRHHNYQPLPPPIQGVRGHSINVHPQAAAVSYRLPSSYAPQNNPINPSQDSSEIGSRHPRHMPPSGLRIYQSHREGVAPEASQRHRNLPYLRVLPPDGVALLEFSEFYEDADDIIDHHRDMRLDIEDMSYEELLALGEQIGKVNTGLSEEVVTSKLKTKTYLAAATYINLEEEAPVDPEADSCIICQEEYKNQEKIGTLDCGHEYHADCLKKWLLVKNVCPICKAEALAT
ncbi:hypothetical protein SLEP1_g14531 [Rubroshorea leprosula]|uniref:RING-type E3 ubiquitin transferase n=1 Tax=Rubroshorea leprosula TaxID=152421 RepID=A0AAV5ITY2_9ROSI|nr:hypothetical protein SLEP1_g14531 [Rubroshorea leprosula]